MNKSSTTPTIPGLDLGPAEFGVCRAGLLPLSGRSRPGVAGVAKLLSRAAKQAEHDAAGPGGDAAAAASGGSTFVRPRRRLAAPSPSTSLVPSTASKGNGAAAPAPAAPTGNGAAAVRGQSQARHRRYRPQASTALQPAGNGETGRSADGRTPTAPGNRTPKAGCRKASTS